MSKPDSDHAAPMAKALAAARDSAQHCLLAAAEALAEKLPIDGVICSRLWRRPGRKPVSVLVLWPCWVLEAECGTGSLIADTHIAELAVWRPDTAAFLRRMAEAGPAKSLFFYPPQSRRQRVTVDALCVLRVHDATTCELRAESEPGQPGVLRAGFEALTPADLAPRLT